MKRRPVHVCAPVAKEHGCIPKKERGQTCDRMGCEKTATHWALFPWGASLQCTKHHREDIAP